MPARAGHPGDVLGEQPGGHRLGALVVTNAAHTWVNTTLLRISARGTVAILSASARVCVASRWTSQATPERPSERRAAQGGGAADCKAAAGLRLVCPGSGGWPCITGRAAGPPFLRAGSSAGHGGVSRAGWRWLAAVGRAGGGGWPGGLVLRGGRCAVVAAQRGPPVRLAEQGHGRRDQDAPDEGGVHGDGDGQGQAKLLDAGGVPGSEAGEHDQHQERGGGDDPPGRCSPWATASSVFPVSSWASLIRDSRNT
jgi:hypothetical protein